ncbi:MAG TPA: hypothetical protein PKL83_04570, partial [bacterium]|nr:hypothetical protein [bacterium]
LPDADEIRSYAAAAGITFSTATVELLSCEQQDSTLYLTFSDALAAYGGGSTHVGSIHGILDRLVYHLPEITSVYSTVDGWEGTRSLDGKLQP